MGNEPDAPARRGPTALPSVGARIVAFAAICVAGLSGLLIGMALVRVQCRGDCAVPEGIGALVGGVVAALGVAIIAVLVLRAMGEWGAGVGGDGDGDQPPPPAPDQVTRRSRR